jgi:hypothetical protein
MDQSTFQKRIEERAKQKLLKDLLKTCNDEISIMHTLGSTHYRPQLAARGHFNSYNNTTSIILDNDYTRELFDKLLPKYIESITDEILQKIDEIDCLLKENQPAEY